ncbi:HEPN domain-containing protein [Paracoccus sp. J55]|uniref:HEPN domain-containing protein n=1 Tax=Paracoccus sp. J55 TaxID=935849 RepID=UPI0012EB81C3|nr:HEPN domain-containing protein [Paracoccus sp. J55]
MFEIDRIRFYASVTKHSFVKPGDYNYIHARFCRATGLHTEFFWQSAQAVEKYLKAAIVANGATSHGYSHKLGKLLTNLNAILGDLGVHSLEKPEELNPDLWTDQPLPKMMEKLETFGDPANRYGLTSYQNDGWDIFVLDKLVWELRRRSVGMSWVIGTDWMDESIPDLNGKTIGYVISNRKDYQPRPITIPKVDFSVMGVNFEDALYSWNLNFKRNSEDISKNPPRSISVRHGGFGNSILPMYLDRAELHAKSSKEDAAEVAYRIQWILQNIQFSNDMQNWIKGILEKVVLHT